VLTGEARRRIPWCGGGLVQAGRDCVGCAATSGSLFERRRGGAPDGSGLLFLA
jgi:hypothetical protein